MTPKDKITFFTIKFLQRNLGFLPWNRKMSSTNRPGKVSINFLFCGLLALWWLFGAPNVSAQTYDFEEGLEAITTDLISVGRAILKNKRIAVFGINEGKSRKEWEITLHIEDGIMNMLVKNGYRVVERRVLDVLQKEIHKSADDYYDPNLVAQVGKLAGADFVVTGSYVQWGQNKLSISIRAINAATGDVVAAGIVKVHTDRIRAAGFLKPVKNENKLDAWQDTLTLRREFAQTERSDGSKDLNADQKADAWKRFLAFFRSKNNPSGIKDDAMREKGEARYKYWTNYSESNVTEQDGIYVVYANGIVRDTKTYLEWKAGPNKDTIWNEAKSWVQSLDLGGDGWRLPTMDELEGLYKKGAGKRNMTHLLKTTGWWVWSGETEGSSCAWDFCFYDGSRCWNNYNASILKRVFAVRSQSER